MAKIKKEYTCALILTADIIGGKWKLRILWHILHGDNRFSLLQKAISDITHKMLITQLKELVESGILLKIDHNELPPRVEYFISEKYKGIESILDNLCDFTRDYAQKNEITIIEE